MVAMHSWCNIVPRTPSIFSAMGESSLAIYYLHFFLRDVSRAAVVLVLSFYRNMKTNGSNDPASTANASTDNAPPPTDIPCFP
jgi:hypothetical protein